jgi:hypothetical protein
MKIYKLTPILEDYAGWKRSTYRGELIIRANDESDARNIAALTLNIHASMSAREPTPPWGLPEVVSGESIEDSQFSVHGRREILFPPDLDTEFPDSPSFNDA